MALTPPLSGFSGIVSDEVGDDMEDATREAAERGSRDEGRWSKCSGGFSPMRRNIPGLSLNRTPSIHSATMTFFVEYSGYTLGI